MSTGVGFRSERGPILIAVMVVTALVAIDVTILATAIPAVVEDLGGFAEVPWLFSVYLLAQGVSIPIYSKLADVYGRKPVILFGIGLFLVASVLCGAAWSMPVLIAARAAQGFAAGAIQPVAVTIAGDVYTVAERARVQAYISGVWAGSAIVGPAMGGLFSEFVSWRWIFFINVPLCIISASLIWRHLRENVPRRPARAIDWPGAVLLAASLSTLLVALVEGIPVWDWTSPIPYLVVGAGTFLLVAFFLCEKRAENPILPLWMLKARLTLATSMIAMCVGMVLLGLTSYLPAFLEIRLGISPLASGLTVAALTIGWPVSAVFSGWLYLRFGFRLTAILGAFVTFLGASCLRLAAVHPSLVLVTLCCLLIGVGLGAVSTPSLIAAQASVSWEERGVATGMNLFARTIGGGVGVALLGMTINSVLGGVDPRSDPLLFERGMGLGLLWVNGLAALSIVMSFLMPKDARTGKTQRPPAETNQH